MAERTDRPILTGLCPLTGRPCETAQALADLLASALASSWHAAGPEFSATGTVETPACGRLCRLGWSGAAGAIAVAGWPVFSDADGPGLRRPPRWLS